MKLWTLGIVCLGFSLPAVAQTCPHTVTRSPVGPVLVYQNGLLLALGTNYTYTTAPGTFPVIGPLSFAVGDLFQVVFTRQVPLSFTYQGVKVPYIGYALWQESWTCTQGNKTAAPALASLQVCSGSGASPAGNSPVWDPAVTYVAGTVVGWASASWISAQSGNVGNPPDTSGLWWNGISWDCSGLYAVGVKLANGSLLSFLGSLGAPAAVPGIVWTPVQ